MKIYFIRILAILTITVMAMSCKKYSSGGILYPANDRKIRFQLYTNKDFSGNTSVINFSIFIRDTIGVLFDSSIASMQIKDIPDAAHKLVIEKTVPGNDHSDLAAGFRYEIENVGNSSYTDTSKAGNAFKIIDFAFH
ncbi:MAG: hypothetical protein ACHQF0_03565 [Chitinophagales bacterium]